MKMDINTTYSIQKGWLPERYRNQIDQSYSIIDNYVSEKERAFDEAAGEPQEETTVHIETSYKEI